MDIFVINLHWRAFHVAGGLSGGETIFMWYADGTMIDYLLPPSYVLTY